jgi:hypothetical protein
MPDSTIELKPMPIVHTVQVLGYDEQGQPWPLATIHIDLAGKIAFHGNAGKAYSPLLSATKKASVRIAHEAVNAHLREKNPPTEEGSEGHAA